LYPKYEVVVVVQAIEDHSGFRAKRRDSQVQ